MVSPENENTLRSGLLFGATSLGLPSPHISTLATSSSMVFPALRCGLDLAHIHQISLFYLPLSLPV